MIFVPSVDSLFPRGDLGLKVMMTLKMQEIKERNGTRDSKAFMQVAQQYNM